MPHRGTFDEARIRAFNRERNEMLEKDSVDAMLAFYEKHYPGQRFSSRDVAEAAMHKARTAIPAISAPLRAASHAWLKERGFYSLDDGELGR